MPPSRSKLLAATLLGTLHGSAWAAPTRFPEITTAEKTDAGCYPLLPGSDPLDRLEMAALPRAAAEASSRCVSPHARFYLRSDADVVVFVDGNRVIRTSHVRSHVANKAAVGRDDEAIEEARRNGASHPEVAALREQRRKDRRMAAWHGFWGAMNRISGRDDGRDSGPEAGG